MPLNPRRSENSQNKFAKDGVHTVLLGPAQEEPEPPLLASWTGQLDHFMPAQLAAGGGTRLKGAIALRRVLISSLLLALACSAPAEDPPSKKSAAPAAPQAPKAEKSCLSLLVSLCERYLRRLDSHLLTSPKRNFAVAITREH